MGCKMVKHPRIWSLLAIMNQFHAEQLAGIVSLLQVLQSGADCTKVFMNQSLAVEPDDMNRYAAVLRDAEPLFRTIGLEHSRLQVELANSALPHYHDQNVSTFAAEIRRILETLLTELSERHFLYVAPDRDNYYENENLFGETVLHKFPAAKSDIIAAGNCLCAECHMAAVFHLMRAFEFALRLFCDELGLKRMFDWDKVNGKFKYTPANYAVWEKQLNQLPKKVEKRLGLLRPGPRKQKLQEYYAQSLEDIKAVKDAWRNHVMHARKIFDRSEAESVFGHVKGIMGRMSA